MGGNLSCESVWRDVRMMFIKSQLKTVISRQVLLFFFVFLWILKNEHVLKRSKNITLKLTNKSIVLGPLTPFHS